MINLTLEAFNNAYEKRNVKNSVLHLSLQAHLFNVNIDYAMEKLARSIIDNASQHKALVLANLVSLVYKKPKDKIKISRSTFDSLYIKCAPLYSPIHTGLSTALFGGTDD